MQKGPRIALFSSFENIAIVEMPPGPPVLQTVVAEIHGPDAETRREVARKMTEFFEQAGGVVAVDNYMAEPSQPWHFEIDKEKAIHHETYRENSSNLFYSCQSAFEGFRFIDTNLRAIIIFCIGQTVSLKISFFS